MPDFKFWHLSCSIYVSDGTDDFSGVTIILSNNIDLNDKQWTPIGHYDPVGEYKTEKVIFSGTFDGQNHIITGFCFKDENCETVALFGYLNGTVKNFTVKGEITAKSGAGVIGGLEKGETVENVTSYVDVVSSISDTKAKFGSIVLTLKDKLTTDGGYTIKGCKNY